jgi:putative OmpL-like beta-barrel porin-2
VAATAPATGLVDNPDSGSRFRHFADLIVDVRPVKELRFLLNADYGVEKAPSGTTLLDGTVVDSWKWYGVNLGVGYQVNDVFSIGLRGEYYRDPQGFTMLTNQNTEVIDGTLTLAASPTPNLILKLDNRIDSANQPFFQKGIGETSKTQFTTTLGVVGTTGM